MRITLDHTEIDQALIDYVRKQGLNVQAGDIVLTAKDNHISASLSTTFLTAAVPSPKEQTTTTTAECTEEPDREVLKEQLDKLGIEYAPKARTATLQALLDDAEKHQKKEQPAEESATVFGSSDPEEEPPPFDMKEESPATEESKEESEPDDDAPLFGS